uniref:ASNSD1 upstream open reading frame n=1 Tax=Rhinolophus ferrumequinum TaxID=59479 RepID=A0A671F0H0_RHIFE
IPFREARPENGAGLVPADNSAPHKEELSFKTEQKCFLKAKIYWMS